MASQFWKHARLLSEFRDTLERVVDLGAKEIEDALHSRDQEVSRIESEISQLQIEKESTIKQTNGLINEIEGHVDFAKSLLEKFEKRVEKL